MNDNSDLPILSENIDKSQVPPIDQKRMVAFINHFIVNTVTFLNEFMRNVESKFIEFESKLQTIEASLQIVEAKMASVPDVGDSNDQSTNKNNESQLPTTVTKVEPSTWNAKIENDSQKVTETIENEPDPKESVDVPDNTVDGIKACEDTRYRKFFKMVQFGVPPPAVKLKMSVEGLDPNVLDDPNRILEDGIKHIPAEEA